jgi:hypothetical protein
VRVQRTTSSDGRRKYTTALFSPRDVLAALVEYAERHSYVYEWELRGFKLQWTVSHRYVDGHSPRTFIYLKTSTEVDHDQPDSDATETSASESVE